MRLGSHVVTWVAMIGMGLTLPACDERPTLPAASTSRPALASGPSGPIEPPVPPDLEPAPVRPGPHGGVRIAIGERSDSVEWMADTGTLCFLDGDDGPLAGVEAPVLFVATPAGPEVVELVEGGDPTFGASCRTVVGDQLAGADGPRVVRFRLEGTPWRVRLVGEAASSRPGSSSQPAARATGAGPR